MLASTRYKRGGGGGGLDPTSFTLSHPHKIFPPQPFLPLYIVFKKRIYSSFEIETRKPRSKNKEVKHTIAINNFRKNSKR
jgi:hypothetical protein